MAYWNFANDKPTHNTNLKAGWGLHEYTAKYWGQANTKWVSSITVPPPLLLLRPPITRYLILNRTA